MLYFQHSTPTALGHIGRAIVGIQYHRGAHGRQQLLPGLYDDMLSTFNVITDRFRQKKSRVTAQGMRRLCNHRHSLMICLMITSLLAPMWRHSSAHI